MIELIKEYNFYRTGARYRNRKLNQKEEIIFLRFLNWLHENSDKIKFFYRGTQISKLKERIRKNYQVEKGNHIMNYLFEFGEKSKSYSRITDNNEKAEKNFLININDISERTFEYIFIKIQEILNISEDYTENFKQNNPLFLKYFSEDESNLEKFIYTINSLNDQEKIDVRDYYLRFIHSIYHLGEKNQFSLFVSTSTDESKARSFKGDNDDNILILYWLPKPINRFGINLQIIHEMNEIIILNDLPSCFSEFFPKDSEFSVKGALLREHIIGYLELDKIIINPNIFNHEEFNEDKVENGIYSDNINLQRRRLKEISNYSRQVVLKDNLLFKDINLET